MNTSLSRNLNLNLLPFEKLTSFTRPNFIITDLKFDLDNDYSHFLALNKKVFVQGI